MITFRSIAFAPVLACLVALAYAGPDKDKKPLVIRAELSDGSIVIGEPQATSVILHTSFAKLNLPLDQVFRITFKADKETARTPRVPAGSITAAHGPARPTSAARLLRAITRRTTGASTSASEC